MSDLHLGHNKTSALHIISNLDKVICDSSEFAKLDLLILAGDIFDRLLNLPADEVFAIRSWARRVMILCAKYNVVLRILEGTPSHDRRQSRIFTELQEHHNFKLDMRYVDILEIEQHKELGISILYVPDEWRHKASDTQEEVVELMKTLGLTQLDIAVMHGVFEYQVPEVVRVRHGNILHNAEFYLKIIKHYIFIGHHHTFSTLDRIVAHGSFDRLSQGYEAPKGCVRATIFGDERKLIFVENKGAKIYKTIDVIGLNAEEVTNLVHSLMEYPEGSYFRFRGRRTDHAIAAIRSIESNHRTMNFDTVLIKDEEEEVEETSVIEDTYVPMQINENNVRGMVMDYLAKKNVPEWQINACGGIIDGYLAKRVKSEVGRTVPTVDPDFACA